MKSFQSTLIRGGHGLSKANPNGNSSLKDQALAAFNDAMNAGISSTTSGRGLDIAGLMLDAMPDYKEDLKHLNFLDGNGEIKYVSNRLSVDNRQINVENPFRFGTSIFGWMNNYRGYLENVPIIEAPFHDITTGAQANNNVKVIVFDKITPSLFNPMYGLISSSITDNVPLLDDVIMNTKDMEQGEFENITDCSIKRLVELSREDGIEMSNTKTVVDEIQETTQKDKDGNTIVVPQVTTTKDSKGNKVNSTNINTINNAPSKWFTSKSLLGSAKYKYADFMYCADLGKKSNNHLITLRKFALPIGDDITQKMAHKDDIQPDIARLVTWFGTEDNKLEDIMSYDVEATWEELTAEHEEKDSQEQDKSRGLVGNFINMTSGQYQQGVRDGKWNDPFVSSLLGKWGGEATYAGNPAAMGAHYDKNKIYDPVNTVRSTHKYKGELKFGHEFTLKFRYKLRAYDNINPKSAFLDLLSNILMMTYKKGNFWKGSRSILGPPTNSALWAKADALLDKGTTKLQGIFSDLMDGNLDLGSLLGDLANMLGDAVNTVKDAVESNGGVTETIKKLGNAGIGMIAGQMRNKLGRPAMYAFQSLLDSSNVGLWHVTIGNPLNPIASIGNLIMTKAKISHSGPLGIDDFPTELLVECSLKHGRPRDAEEIQRMYTKGMRAIYYAYANVKNTKEGGKKWFDRTKLDMRGDYFGTPGFDDKDRINSVRDELT